MTFQEAEAKWKEMQEKQEKRAVRRPHFADGCHAAPRRTSQRPAASPPTFSVNRSRAWRVGNPPPPPRTPHHDAQAIEIAIADTVRSRLRHGSRLQHGIDMASVNRDAFGPNWNVTLRRGMWRHVVTISENAWFYGSPAALNAAIDLACESLMRAAPTIAAVEPARPSGLDSGVALRAMMDAEFAGWRIETGWLQPELQRVTERVQHASRWFMPAGAQPAVQTTSQEPSDED